MCSSRRCCPWPRSPGSMRGVGILSWPSWPSKSIWACICCGRAGNCVESSNENTWGETSNSFRMGVFGFLWRALFPSSLFCFFAVWLWLLRFFWGFLFLALIFFFRILRINHLYFVTANGQLFSSSFEMLGTHIDLGLGIRPLECGGNQLHQVIHEHPTAFLWVE